MPIAFMMRFHFIVNFPFLKYFYSLRPFACIKESFPKFFRAVPWPDNQRSIDLHMKLFCWPGLTMASWDYVAETPQRVPHIFFGSSILQKDLSIRARKTGIFQTSFFSHF